MSIVHGDIKPENILLNENKTVVKFCDLGLSRVKKTLTFSKTQSAIIGTHQYLPPECARQNIKPSKCSDIWSLCGTLVELFADTELWKVPGTCSDMRRVIDNAMKKRKQPSALKILKKKNKLLFSILRKGFDYNPRKRPSADEMLQQFEKLPK